MAQRRNLPIGQAALAAGLTRDQIRRLAERHEVRAEYVNGRLFIAAADVERIRAERAAALA